MLSARITFCDCTLFFVSLKCGVTSMLHVNTLSWNAWPFDDGTGTLSRNVANKTYHQRHAALQKGQDLNCIAGRGSGGGRLKFPINGPLTCTIICLIFVRVFFFVLFFKTNICARSVHTTVQFRFQLHVSAITSPTSEIIIHQAV
jgi:hypothetical protein